MLNSTKYFQLTPSILVEYNYHSVNSAYNQSGAADDHIIDMGLSETGEKTGFTSYVVYNGYDSTRSFVFYGDENMLVLPINKSESKFIKCVSDNTAVWEWSDFTHNPISQDTGTQDTDDILCDNFKLHFTSKNYFGDYEGIIIRMYIYDKIKNKIGLLSYIINKNDDMKLNDNPMLINQKLYTTYINFLIPNINALVNTIKSVSNGEVIEKEVLPGEELLRTALSPRYKIMDNTPIVMDIYGVKSSNKNNGIEYYTTEKINTIYIPLIDKSNRLSIEVKEAEDGDYFKIYPVVDDGKVSFSDYLYTISDGRPEIYIVFHELMLIEHFTNLNAVQNETTHREQYIVNVSSLDNEINEDELDKIMYFRPVLRHAAKDVSFTISVQTKIINTLDNTTTLKRGTLTYDNPKKYGKKMNKIYLGDVPAQVNVYNKKPDIDIDGVKITNGSSNVKIENHQHSIIGFIECANVGVSIEQVPKEQLN